VDPWAWTNNGSVHELVEPLLHILLFCSSRHFWLFAKKKVNVKNIVHQEKFFIFVFKKQKKSLVLGYSCMIVGLPSKAI